MLFIVPDDSSPNKPGDSADSGTSLDVTLDVEDDDSPAASPGKVEMAVQLVSGGESQRRWVQRSVLAVDLAAVALMGLLNLALA